MKFTRLFSIPFLLSMLLSLSACGGGDSAGDDSNPRNVVSSLSAKRVFVQTGDPETVEIHHIEGATLATNFSEDSDQLSITTGDCTTQSVTCQAWENRPRAAMQGGTHRVTIGDLASLDSSGSIDVSDAYYVNHIPSSLLGKKGANRLSTSSFSRSIYVHQTNAPLSGWGVLLGRAGGVDLLRLSDYETSVPREMQFARVYQRVTPGLFHNLMIDAGGNLFAQGSNHNGELGDGTTRDRSRPVRVSGLGVVSDVDPGRTHTLAVSNGQAWAWGANSDGQLGDGTFFERISAVPVQGVTQVVAVAAGGDFSLALSRDGSVWTWGDNTVAQFTPGRLTHRDSSTPLQVSGLPAAQAVDAGENHALALAQDGSVWGWGATTLNRSCLTAMIMLSSPSSMLSSPPGYPA